MEVAISGLAFLLSWAMTKLLRHHAVPWDMIDRPNGRSSHVVPTPRGGGLAVVVVFLAFCFWPWRFWTLLPGFSPALVGGGLSVALVGFLDDRGHVPAGWRLLVHGVAAMWAIVWFGGPPALTVGRLFCEWPWWGAGVAVCFLVWLINLYNFMDGIDGIAGVEAVSATLGAAVILAAIGERGIVPPLLILAGAVCGFLRWNWPPAKIFMGDAGSGFLGFVLGLFALFVPMHSRMRFWSWLILLGVFLVDATVTLLVRVFRWQRLHIAHRSHAYQHLARRWRSHRVVTLGVVAINVLWLFPLALAATWYPAQGLWLTGLSLAPLVGVSLWAGAGREG